VAAALRRARAKSGGGDGSSLDASPPPRLALVFGREEFGLSDAEVRSCALACELPMGRLVESLSLSHAAAIALSALYCAAADDNDSGCTD
jgi:tRNA C32,U32 (ribose-2'-O)-methylase TrmJ